MIWALFIKQKYIIKMEIKTSKTYKGTRIVFGETARNKRRLLNQMIDVRILWLSRNDDPSYSTN